MKDLAIVIPAYKIDFFKFTLDSLASQTDKNFTVYIGNDNSREDFESLIKQYDDKIDIKYYKFQNNLGSNNLVAQWTRCIDLTQGEPWIWLFSDDDIMGSTCVEKFYEQLSKDCGYNIFHFNVQIINDKGMKMRDTRPYPNLLSAESLYLKKELCQLDSFVVEYVFSRAVYESMNGFQYFDLAWGSDIATWVKFASDEGIKTINDEYVFWRFSQKNITPKMEQSVAFRKCLITIDYLKWVNDYFNSKKVKIYNAWILFRYAVFYSRSLNNLQVQEMLVKARNARIIDYSLSVIIYYIIPAIKLIKKIR